MRFFFSQISLEIAIKQKIGKLPDFKINIERVYNQALDDGFAFLEIENRHINAYHEIPLYEQHRDPFDRLLIATAYIENSIVLTVDRNFSLYPEFIKIQW